MINVLEDDQSIDEVLQMVQFQQQHESTFKERRLTAAIQFAKEQAFEHELLYMNEYVEALEQKINEEVRKGL